MLFGLGQFGEAIDQRSFWERFVAFTNTPAGTAFVLIAGGLWVLALSPIGGKRR